MMKEQKSEYSLLVYVKNKYKYGKQEEKLAILANKLGGREIGGGTCLATGKRDKQYYFKTKAKAEAFLAYPTVQETILKEYELVGVTE